MLVTLGHFKLHFWLCEFFLLHEVRPQCRYVLSNLASGYTRSTWHAGSTFVSNYIEGTFVILGNTR